VPKGESHEQGQMLAAMSLHLKKIYRLYQNSRDQQIEVRLAD
jgi:hypothetical protein